MAVKIHFDPAGIPELPALLLANRNGEILGQIPAKNIVLKDSLNNAAEISFCVYKYTDGKQEPIWDKIVNSRLVWCKEWDLWFELTTDIDESDKTVKNISCIQLAQAELSQVNLYNIEINTENDIAREDYLPTVLFSSEKDKDSLLRRIMEKVPHYSVAHVDSSISNIQRTFSFDGTSLYDAFQQIAEEIGCLFRFHSGTIKDGTMERAISVYDLQSVCLDGKCRHRGEFTGKCPKCGSTDISEGFGKDTSIFITSDELSDEIQFTTDSGSVKNCFKLEAGDDLMTAAVRSCNPNGSDYIWHISEDTKKIMSEELVAKLAEYDKKYIYYQNTHVVNLDKELYIRLSVIEAEHKKLPLPLRYPLLYGYAGKYNPVAEQYGMLEKMGLPDSAAGYPALITAYYNTLDLEHYLRSSMMPEITVKDTNAETEIKTLTEKLSDEDFSQIAVSDVSKLTEPTVKSAALSLAKVLIDSRYKVEIKEVKEDSNSNSQTWQIAFTVTNYSDEKDTAASSLISIQFTDNQAVYLKQSIEKMLKKNYKDDTSISGLFQTKDFADNIKEYCLNRLLSFFDACEACIQILTEEGLADSGNSLHESLYIPYTIKRDSLQSEITRRLNSINIVKAMQEYIEEEQEKIQKELNFEEFLKKDGDKALWPEFCSYRREDKYSNSNYISDGLSNAEIFDKAQAFIETARNELYKSAELQHSISTSLKNLLVIEKFNPLTEHFEVGNWFRIQVDDEIYKLRMTEYEINYEELDTISVGFSDLLSTASGVSDMESIIQNTASMTKSYSSIQRQARQGAKGNSLLQNWVEDGLNASNVKIMNEANNQTQTWDEHGMLFRQYNYTDDTYFPTQMRITDSSILFTDDDWDTVKTAIGNIYYRNPEYDPDAPSGDPKSREFIRSYGINAETIVGKLLLGQQLGIHNQSGSFTFDETGLTVKNDVNTFRVMPENNDNLISLTTKKNNNEEELIFGVNSDGELFIKGDGKDLDLTENKAISDISAITSNKIGRGEDFQRELIDNSYYVGSAWNNITNQVQLETNDTCNELCFYTPGGDADKQQRLSSKINHNGNLFYSGGKLIGRIGTSALEQDSSKKGLLFELDSNGSHISFTRKEEQENDTISQNMLCISSGNDTYPDGVHFGCSIHGHGVTMDNVNLTNASFHGQHGITREISVITDIKKDSEGNITPAYSTITIKNGIITDVS